MASKRKRLGKRIDIRLREDDIERLKLIGEIHGVSFSAAIRAAIRAMAEQLGITAHRNISNG
jgi:predicted DNA binding CopG/RHH family protein